MTDAEITPSFDGDRPSFDENQPQGAPAPSDTPLYDQPTAAGQVGGGGATDQEPELPAPDAPEAGAGSGSSAGSAGEAADRSADSGSDALEKEALHNEEQP